MRYSVSPRPLGTRHPGSCLSLSCLSLVAVRVSQQPECSPEPRPSALSTVMAQVEHDPQPA
eukprot:3204529-Rhodomonas_salina.2